MEASRDRTDEWLLTEAARPPTLAELVGRIEAVEDRAGASETAVSAIGDAALDAADRARASVEQAKMAAEQAHRAAKLVERLSEGAPAEQRRPEPDAPTGAPPRVETFAERADRVIGRLQAIGRVPLTPRPASGAPTP
jgi:hypothetical protein